MKEAILTPNWPNVAKFQANALLTHSIELSKEPQFMLTFVEGVAYLAANDRVGYHQFHEWLKNQVERYADHT